MWTHTELASEHRLGQGSAWRVVEHQHTVSTRKIVDTREEQELLEGILEDSKPIYPPGTEHLSYLLKTPFRYLPAHPHGSRFRRAGDGRGVFYCSAEQRSALAEAAFWRRYVIQRSPGTPLPKTPGLMTVFSIAYRTSSLIDLTRPPLDRDRLLWTHPDDYRDTQALADVAREAGTDIIRYESVRDPGKGDNLALLTPKAFTGPMPTAEQVWYMYLDASETNCTRAMGTESFVFSA